MIRLGCDSLKGDRIRIKRGADQLDLRGKTIDGNIVLVVSEKTPLPWLRLDGTTINGSLIIRADTPDRQSDFCVSHAVAQIEGRGLTIAGDLRIENVAIAGLLLNNAHVRGDVRLTTARILSLSNACCRADKADAIRMRDVTVGGSMFVRGAKDRRRGSLAGRVFMAGSRIGGTVEFSGIDFQETSRGRMVTLANAQIGGDVAWLANREFGGPCAVRGHFNLDSSHVGGRLRIAVRATGDTCISLKASEIDAAIQVWVEEPAASPGHLQIDASDAITDAIQLWGYGREGWSLRATGTTYGGLAGTRRGDPKASPRLDRDFLLWFLRSVVTPSVRPDPDPDADADADAETRAGPHRAPGREFSLQPYQRFIALCRNEGYNDVADDAVAAWVQQAHSRGAGRFFYRAFDAIARYGLSPWRATRCALGAVIACTLLVALLQWYLPDTFVDPEPQNLALNGTAARQLPSADRQESIRIELTEPQHDPGFECASRINAFVYALDVMLPLADFRQEEQCPQRGASGERPVVAVAAIGLAVFRFAGAILTALMLLTFSGINRRIWR